MSFLPGLGQFTIRAESLVVVVRRYGTDGKSALVFII